MTWLTRSRAVLLAVLLALITLVSVLQISDSVFRTARIDLTETQHFTLSRGTKNTLRTLQEPITLKFFFSERVSVSYPRLRVYARRVKDLLRTYSAYSDGMVRVEFFDVEPFSEEEDEAVALGINPAPTASGEDLYFGLVGTNAIDGEEIIPFFVDEREPFLEYDLTSLIYKLSQSAPSKVGLLSSIPLEIGVGGPMAAMQGQAQPLYLYELLRDNFDLINLEAETTDIQEDIRLLVLVHPNDLPDQTLYAIDQFVLRGGRVLVFVDPLSELAQQMASPAMGGGAGGGPSTSSSLDKLFEAWGVGFDSDEVVSDRAYALQVQTGIVQQPVIDYPVWLALRDASFDGQDLVVSDISLLQLASAGVVRQTAGAGTQFSPLVQSSDNAMLSSAQDVEETFDPIQFLIDFQPTGEVYTLAARVSGQVQTAFPQGRPGRNGTTSSLDTEDGEGQDADRALDDAVPADTGDAATQPSHLSASTEPVNIIVVADTDIWDDKFWVQRQNFLGQTISVPTADNGVFVQNAVENLLGSNDLISLRSRGRDERPKQPNAA